jgi:hypothetical protein
MKNVGQWSEDVARNEPEISPVREDQGTKGWDQLEQWSVTKITF